MRERLEWSDARNYLSIESEYATKYGTSCMFAQMPVDGQMSWSFVNWPSAFKVHANSTPNERPLRRVQAHPVIRMQSRKVKCHIH